MATITVSLPTDTTTAEVADYNTPITTIVNEINGGLSSDNLAANAVTTAKITDGNVTGAKLETNITLTGYPTIPFVRTASGGISCVHNTATPFYFAPSPGMFLVTCHYSSDEADNPYSGFAVISTDGTTRNKIHLSNFGTAVAITVTNLDFRITQTSGATLVMLWSVMRLY